MVNIKVAVRIRPLSERELLHGEEIIVRKENKSVLVTNPKIPERHDGDGRQRTRRFAVDFCYDSRDPEGGSQEAVYNEIGSEVLHAVREGYNACVLAYGHSASGKTYTVMGLRDDPGLTPRLCEGLFEATEGRPPEGRVRLRVVVSFLEIYNEKVRDLLGGEDAGGASGGFCLRVREHPKLGPYVQGLSEHSVADKESLLELLSTGNGRRSTAATESNAVSSRSHAVFTIRVQRSDGEEPEAERRSKVHLVDLAGSERARSSQSRARLQEGASINKSLAALGNVISALAESQGAGLPSKARSESSKCWRPFVPYRDSVLTWLLKDALGGNSNTIMIATVSPAGSCAGETVNTLRYAKRAKRIANAPTVNEDPKVRAIRELRQEVARLRGLLALLRSCGGEADPREETAAAFPRLVGERPGPGGAQVTIEEERRIEEGGRGERSTAEDAGAQEEEEEEDGRRGVRTVGAAPSGGDACGIDDEKKSDVNGSVNDNFSHETQFFSDSLESFSSVLPKSGSRCDADGSGGGGGPAEGRSGSHGKPGRRGPPEMLRRSRPDLIKGISGRGGEDGPAAAGSSRSWTDVSNLGRSTSENSLNSSGSAEAQPPEGGPSRSAGAWRSGPSEATSKKREKRLEIVEAVTSRLYASKKKPDRGAEAPKKEEGHEDGGGDPEEPKLCKRARMKLFDLSRKLAMSRKTKKTVDIDTQTECSRGTLRVKEKSVTTEESAAAAAFETAASDDGAGREDKKPYVIMNQVFVPAASRCVVECGEVVRVEGPEVHESATQTPSAGERRKAADVSPVAFRHREEDRFSEDSLDSEKRGASRGGRWEEEDDDDDDDGAGGSDSAPEAPPRSGRPTTSETRRRRDFGQRPTTPSSGSRRPETPSESECSSASTESAESNCLSETSSEDFVFYENPKEPPTDTRATGDRELYTITENSEQSDPGDAFSPVRRRRPPRGAGEERRAARRSGGQRDGKGLGGRREGRETSRSFEGEESKARTPRERRERIPVPFLGARRSAADVPKASGTARSPARDGLSRNDDRPPNDAKARRFSGCADAGNDSEMESAGCLAGDAERGSNRTDFRIDCEKQYLNLNISAGGGGVGRAPPFSVDTHLFERASRREQSADAMSASADSITFVFMGPAKPKTSVLMELIGRSLGRSASAGEAPRGQRKSRSRGVQCDAGLTRSVSVDTAMIALSRIARNQESSPELQRTTSLGELDPDEAPALLGRGNLRSVPRSGCRCELEGGRRKGEAEGWGPRGSAGTNAVFDRRAANAEKSKRTEAEKPKKTVSWFREAETETETETKERGNGWRSEGPAFESERRSFAEVEADESSAPKFPVPSEADFPERRVRFLKPETSVAAERADDLTAFLKEATRLLKSINSRSSAQRAFSEDGIEEFGAEWNGRKDDNRKGGPKASKRTEGPSKSRTDGRPEKAPGSRPRTAIEAYIEEGGANLTWPRRRAPTGKPPTGTKTRFPRSPVPPRLESLRASNCFPIQRTWTRSGRAACDGQPRNPSSLSAAALGDAVEVGGRGDPRFPPAPSPRRANVPAYDPGSVSDSETDPEEWWRRSESAAGERKKKAWEWEWEWEGQGQGAKPREAAKRRKAECAGGCVCGASGREPCRRLWSRGCRSSFELDSFGPGSAHCHQLCMFCRKKEAEVYHSAVSLNSECASGLCRLNYYGFCPCSPVKLSRVAPSPRAYMQRLLALRRRIVGEARRDPEEARDSPRGGLAASPLFP